MSALLKLYTFGDMADAQITAVTSEATGYPAEHVIDDDPDTYFKGTSVADQYITMDFGAAISVRGAFWWVNNYKTLTQTTTGQVEWSDNGSSWSATSTQDKTISNIITTPNRIAQWNTELSHRYWRARINQTSAIAEVSMFALYQYFELDQGNDYPEDNVSSFANRNQRMKSGRVHTTALGRNVRRSFNRVFTGLDETQMETLRDAHLHANGTLKPLVFQESTTDLSAIVVKFTHDEVAENCVSYGVYSPQIAVRELAWIEGGKPL